MDEPRTGFMRVLQCTLFSLLLASYPSFAGLEYNLPLGVSPASHDIYYLHMAVFWVCVGIGLIVFGIMLYSLIYHRKGKGATPAKFHSHLSLEIIWTLIPLFILVALAIPGTRVLLHLNDVKNADLTIKVTGYQWKWRYEYLGTGVQFFSNLSTPLAERQGKKAKNPHYLQEVDNPLVIPTHKKIRFVITSNDVIHSWYVPALGVKRDGVPGFINEIWTRVDRPGTYVGQCAQLCGLNHAYMPIVIVAKSEKEFNEWFKQKSSSKAASSPSTTAGTATSPLGVEPSGSGASSKAAMSAQSPAVTEKKQAVSPSQNTSVPTHAAGKMNSSETTGSATTDASSAAANQSATSSTANPSTPSTTTSPIANATGPSTNSTNSPANATSSTTNAAPNPTGSLSKEDLMKKGEQVYQTTCVACHQPNGEGMPPLYPSLKGSAIAKGPLAAHIDIVLNGKPGTAMQAFRDQLSDEELAGIITYERNAWGNNTGDVIQPDQIKKAKEEGTP